jgi:hypothetical protein
MRKILAAVLDGDRSERAPAPSAALSEEDPLAGAPRGDENTGKRSPLRDVFSKCRRAA